MDSEKAIIEREIMRQFERTGELDFEPLFLHHAPTLLRIASGMLRNSSEAENAVQETFLDAYRYIIEGNFDFRRGSIGGLLRKMLMNCCIDYLRKNSPIVHFQNGEEDMEKIVDIRGRSAQQVNPEELLLRKELMEDIRRAIQRLPSRLRFALLLRVVEEAPYQRVGEALDTSPVAARMAVSRARTALRKLIEMDKGDISS